MRLMTLITIASAATLSGAWFFELGLGLEPCPLCLTQRLPYYMALLFGLIYFITKKDEKAFLLIFVSLFIYSTGLAGYHAGAEWALWPGPASCGGSKPLVTTTSDFLKSINATKIVDCTAVQWRLFGLSLAGYNAIISFMLALLSLKALILDPSRENPTNSHANN